MDNNQEPENAPDMGSDDRYATPNKLLRIASWAYTLSWVILALDVILFIGRLVFQFLEGMSIDILTAFNVLFYLYTLLGGIIWFVVLQAVSEGIYLWLDIEENQIRNNTQ